MTAGRITIRDASAPDQAPPVPTREPSSWAPVDLSALEPDESAQPRYLPRTDGVALLYPGKVHAFIGESESGKSLLTQYLVTLELAAGHTVAVIDFEDSAGPYLDRLDAFGVARADTFARFTYVSPSEPLGDAQGRVTPALLDLVAWLEAVAPDVVILDGVTEAMSLEGLSPLDNGDVATWWARAPRFIANRGPAVAMVDHVTKDRETRGRFAIGAQHKLSAIDGAAYVVELQTPFIRGGTGSARVSVTKDRPGHVRPHAVGKTIATFHVTSTEHGITAELKPPSTERAGNFRPTTIMERVSRRLEDGTELTKNSIRAAVAGKNGAIDLAVDVLVAEGFLEVHKSGQSHHHRSVKPYRAADDPKAEGDE